MAEQGFLPAEKFEVVRQNAEETISRFKKEAETWKTIARKRLGELQECGKLLRAICEAEEKELDKSIMIG